MAEGRFNLCLYDVNYELQRDALQRDGHRVHGGVHGNFHGGIHGAVHGAVHNSTAHTNNRNVDMWSNENIERLVRVVRDFYPRLIGKQEKGNAIWREIFTTLTPQIPGVTLYQCKIKWKNIRHAFVKYVQNLEYAGSSKLKEPPAYNLLCSFLEVPKIQPVTVHCGLLPVSSSISVAQDGAEAEEARPPPKKKKKNTDDQPARRPSVLPKKIKRISMPVHGRKVASMQWEVLQEIKSSGRRLESIMTESAEHQRNLTSNQKDFMDVEKKRIELLERILGLEARRKL